MVLLLLVAVAVNTKLPGAATLVLASGLVRVAVTAAWAVGVKLNRPSKSAKVALAIKSPFLDTPCFALPFAAQQIQWGQTPSIL